MDLSQQFVEELASHPSESLNVELKSWFDLTTPPGIAKIIRGTFSLRNRNGGYFLIGFDNANLRPNPSGAPDQVREAFSVDAIQGIISRFAAVPFQVNVVYAEIGGFEYPVICVPEGVVVPVAVKRDLLDGSKTIIREDDVYFRTLSSNGTPSSSRIKSADWKDLLDICFDNREADIGRFLRKHLGGDLASRLRAFHQIDSTDSHSIVSVRQKSFDVLTEGRKRLEEALLKRNDILANQQAGELGSWSVGFTINPPTDTDDSSEQFLNIISSANPRYSGWPVWLDSRSFAEEKDRPRKRDGAWQSLILSAGRGFGAHLDFYRMRESGEFYMWRVFQDDLTEKVKPLTVFDPTLMIFRVIEVLVTGLAFARALKTPEDGILGFAFRWEKLANREMDPWADRMVFIMGGRTSMDDTVESYVEIPVSTSPSAVGTYAKLATDRLVGAFDGMSIPPARYDELVERLLARRF